LDPARVADVVILAKMRDVVCGRLGVGCPGCRVLVGWLVWVDRLVRGG
jgi:hypothetical protein